VRAGRRRHRPTLLRLDGYPIASYWADAFANFGFAGILGFTLVLGLVLWIADGLGQRRDARVAGPMLAIAGLGLASGALFTTILTGGLALGCALTALMPPVAGDAPSEHS